MYEDIFTNTTQNTQGHRLGKSDLIQKKKNQYILTNNNKTMNNCKGRNLIGHLLLNKRTNTMNLYSNETKLLNEDFKSNGFNKDYQHPETIVK